MTPYDVLSRITARPPAMAGAGERCEMCSESIDEDRHQHVVNVEARQLMCVCRGCYLLFTDSNAALRYRAVPDRHLAFSDFGVGAQLWSSLQIPVDLAFFFRNSVLGRVVALYPGPAGATESALEPQGWEKLAAADPRVDLITADVEALLMRSTPSGVQCFLVPIDSCYQLVGGLRRLWRGFGGGQDATVFVDTFFEGLAARAKDFPP